jgi:hypothetical protein
MGINSESLNYEMEIDAPDIFSKTFINSILSVTQVIAAAVVAFVGLGFAVLVIAVAAVVILWLYGSFWTTSGIIILGGNILQFVYY